MRKPIWSVFFIALLLGSQLLAGLQREGLVRPPAARQENLQPRVEVPRVEPAQRAEPKFQSESATAAAAAKEWAERPRLSEDNNTRTQSQDRAERARAEQQRAAEERRVFSFEDAKKRMDHERHDRAWWQEHFATIVLAGTGYYYLDSGYWYPAFGFDSDNDTYPFDGPIAALGDLAPDQVVARVQTKLELDGYYAGPINGVLDEPTRIALTRFQTEHNLDASTGIDMATLIALGLE